MKHYIIAYGENFSSIESVFAESKSDARSDILLKLRKHQIAGRVVKVFEYGNPEDMAKYDIFIAEKIAKLRANRAIVEVKGE
jgi:hypothetical protein